MKFYEIENQGDYLTSNAAEFDIWGIPTGSTALVPANSSEENFYKIFSNSDFLKRFLKNSKNVENHNYY